MNKIIPTQRWTGVLIMLLGIMVMAGWISHRAPLVQLQPEFVGMVFNTAACFVLLGLAFLMPATSSPPAARVQCLLAYVVLAVASAAFFENLFDVSLGVDAPKFHSWLLDGNLRPGRMAPNTALAFMCSAILLVSIQRVNSRSKGIFVQLATFFVLFLGLAGLVGYLLQLDLLYGIRATRMAVHTAAGMVLVALGLWDSWYRADWYRSRQYYTDGDRIVFVGAALLVVIALTAGISGFAAQQATFERVLGQNLLAAVRSQTALFKVEVERAQANARSIGQRPDLVHLARDLAQQPGDANLKSQLQAVVESALVSGVKGIALLDSSKGPLVQAGQFTSTEAPSVALDRLSPTRLVWDQGFYLTSLVPISDAQGQMGTLVVSEPLSYVGQNLGDGSDTRICYGQQDKLTCFPDTSHKSLYEAKRISINGQPTPMALAVAGESGSFKGLDFQDKNVIAGYGPLTANGLGMVVKKSTELLLEPIRQQFKWSIPTLLLLAIAGALLLRAQITPMAMRLLRSEHEAREKELRIHTIMDNVGEGIITLDGQGVIKSFNRAAGQIFGYDPQEAMGQSIKILMPPEMRELHDAGMKRYLGSGEAHVVGKGSVELPGLRKDGSLFQLELAINAMEIDGQMVFVGIVRDITTRKHNEQELRHAVEEAKQASQAKSEFVANMSHEIRTPLNAVLGMTQLLGGTDLSKEQQKYLDMIRVSGKSLLGILNDILDFSKIEAGRMELSPTRFRLSELLHSLASIMGLNSSDKDLELAIDVAGDVPAALIGDAHRLQQVLVNLVGNAIKFTQQGEVAVVVDMVGRESGKVQLRFHVRDTGIGMTSAQLERLFSPFTQADSSMTRKFGGTGLGLVISRRLVALMGGDIEVNSQPNKGSEFVLTLPLQAVKEEAIDNQAHAAHPAGLLAAFKMLVVDDSATSRRVITRITETWGCRVDVAKSGPAALELARDRFAEGRPYDLVLLDWQMPDMDGATTMAALRALSPDTPVPVVMMVSAYGHSQLKGTEPPPDAWLFKPITAPGLFDTLHEILIRLPNGLPELEITSALDASQKFKAHLLLVEDNLFNQIVARGLLEQVGVTLEVVDDGQKAVDLLKERPETFDMVLMDVQMPVMDGFTATRIIRGELGLRLPILAMTAGVTEFERDQCLASGMDDLIAKPIEIDQMLNTIRHYLPGSRPVAVAEQSPNDNSGVLNMAPLLKMLGNNSDNLAKTLGLIANLVVNSETAMEKTHAAIVQGDYADAARLLHGMRGSIGMLGASTFVTEAKLLEEMLNAGGRETLEPQFKVTRAAHATTMAAAREWLAQQGQA